MERVAAAFFALFVSVLTIPVVDAQESSPVRIGTGGIAGTYYPVGRAIAALINRSSATCVEGDSCIPPGVVALPQLSGGTVANLNDLLAGRVELALVQADQIPRDVVPTYSLLGALYGEAVHIVVAADSSLQRIADLAGERVSIDEEGSGTRVNALAVMAEHGVTQTQFTASFYKPEFAAQKLREDELDAFFIVAGTPTRSVAALASEFPVRMLPVDAERAEALVAKYPFLSRVTIPPGTYTGIGAVDTVGVEAYLVARLDLDHQLVDRIMRLLWSREGRRALIEAHRPIEVLTLGDAVTGKALPVHPGALRFLSEQGVNIN